MNSKLLNATHGTIYSEPKSFFGYFGWPTVTRAADGKIYVAASGFRHQHICPWGKNVLFFSDDEGNSWSAPMIINDSLIDDRDAGLTALPDGELLLSWFTSDTRVFYPLFPEPPEFMKAVLDSWDNADVKKELGSFVRLRDMNGYWQKRVPVEVTSPHGPILLKNGKLFYFGNRYGVRDESGNICFDMKNHSIQGLGCAVSSDNGSTWEYRGTISNPGQNKCFVEPHAIELADGRILGLIRVENPSVHFEIWKTFTSDEGRTWTKTEPVCSGSPPHLLRLPDGTLLCSYAWRREPYGIRAMFSRDEGATWDTDWIIRNDAWTDDLGYTSSVILSDGSVLSVYYLGGELCCSRWSIPEGY